MNQIQLVISLFAAYVISDFLIQTDKEAQSKEQFGILIRHCVTAALFSYLLTGFWELWIIPVLIFTTHLCLDFVKIKFSPAKLWIFIVDQFLHIEIFIVLAFTINDIKDQAVSSIWHHAIGGYYDIISILLSGFIITTHVGNLIVGFGVEPFVKEQIDEEISRGSPLKLHTSPTRIGFEKSGKIIGQLERAMIFIFVLSSQPSAIGFLIAAKSPLRFGEIGSGAN